jgi:beta-lactamase class A
MLIRTAAACVLLLATAACGPDRENRPEARAPSSPLGSAQAATAPSGPVTLPPRELQADLAQLGRNFPGDVGIAVKDLSGHWVAAWNPRPSFPQQSSMKIWLGVAVLDAVDRGELALNDTILLQPADLSIHHQPIKGAVLDDGSHIATVEELLRLAISRSDNAATDALIRRLGGTESVEAVLARKGFGALRIGPEERVLHTRLAGLTWRPDYVYPQVFDRERQAVPYAQREALLEAYAQQPMDGATPPTIVSGLEALKEGRLLSPASTERLLLDMTESRTGRSRLKAGVEPGWTVAHKTGTGPDLDAITYGYNDVGLLTAPDGRVYAVAAMIGKTQASIRERQIFLSNVSRAIVEHWKRTHGPDSAATRGEAKLPA